MNGNGNRRKHSKIDILPQDLREAINEQLAGGFTYKEITDWIKNQGHDISESSVGRYGKGFLSKLERLKIVKEQAAAIVNNNQDAPATEMAEAANQMALQLIMEKLMQVNNLDGLKDGKILELFNALSKLEISGAKREAVKLSFNRGVDAAVELIKRELKAELEKDTELLKRLSDLADNVAEEVKKRK